LGKIPSAKMIYQLSKKLASLAFILGKVYKDKSQDKTLIIEHSFGDGLYCHDSNWDTISDDLILQLDSQIRGIIHDEKISFTQSDRSEYLKELYIDNDRAKVEVVNKWQSDSIPVVTLNGYRDIRIEPMETDMSKLLPFKLQSYKEGLLLRIPTQLAPDIVRPFKDRPKLFSVIEEREQWGSILNISTIQEVNETIRNGEINELIWVAEGLHENKLSQIANEIVLSFPEKKVICIAGPSSSGKTTFARRLGIQLRVNGFKTHLISMDDYFIDRKDLPISEDGTQDFESVDALNTELLCNRLKKLLAGESIPKRKFDFGAGVGIDSDEEIQLGEWDLILMEGIHGLNPKLSSEFGKEHLVQIYVSAITQLNIDDHHRMSTSDNRLLRRIVRDFQFRGYSPDETLNRWPSVRLGEEKNIFPFQEEADFMFNTALIHEFPALAKIAIPILKNIPLDEAKRLSTLLHFFEELDIDKVPGTSILREFIGGSEFNY